MFRLRRLVSLLLVSTTLSFPPTSLWAGSLETIQSKVAQYLRSSGARSADWGIEVLDPSNNKVLLQINPDKPFKPASVLKVITTSTALEKLGPDFKYRTGVYTNGAVQPDGTLVGDLILLGRGDPNLIDAYGELLQKPALRELADKLEAMNIKRIQGDVIGDDGYFDPSPYGKGWTARDLKSVYGAPVSALSINNNVFWIQARPTKYKKKVSVSVEPSTSYFTIRNTAITGSSRSRRTIYARLLPGTKTIAVSGVLPSREGYSQYILLERPSEVTTTVFKEELQRHGITASGKVRVIHKGEITEASREGWKLLAEYESVPLIRALEIINKHSQNLHAEMLLRTLGAEFKHDGSDEAGLEVVRQFLLEAVVGGFDAQKVKLNDGCGLSRDNLLTPHFQTSLLQFLSTRPYFQLFANTLSVSGTDGTLRHRMASGEVKGSVRAKTGTLNGVSNLSGYITTKSGRNLAFSIFTNNVNASMWRIKKTIDQICALFVNLY